MLLEKIKELCKSRNINISGLERKCNLGNGTIRRWDVNQPTVGKLKIVSEYFGVGIEYFFSDSKMPSKDSFDLVNVINSLSDEHKNLVKCYISILKKGA